MTAESTRCESIIGEHRRSCHRRGSGFAPSSRSPFQSYLDSESTAVSAGCVLAVGPSVLAASAGSRPRRQSRAPAGIGSRRTPRAGRSTWASRRARWPTGRPKGDAFKGQPIEGDTVNRRRGDMHSRHAGPVLGRHLREGRRRAQGDA